MKKTIKLRDMTKEQFVAWCRENCPHQSYMNTRMDCNEKCPFAHVLCNERDENCWLYNKEDFSDKFLDQTIEIEVPDLLTEEEKALLNKLIGLSAFKIHGINFIICDGYVLVELITANPCEQNDFFHFKKGMFKGIEETKRYAPSDLGLEDK